MKVNKLHNYRILVESNHLPSGQVGKADQSTEDLTVLR